jgi:uncharacterized protein (TIGR03067 family)
MRHCVLALVATVAGVVVVACVAAEPPKEEAANKERERLQGTWVAGREPGDSVELVIRGETISFSESGKESKYKLYPSLEPKGIDVIDRDGTWKGIYELDGDRLRLGMPFITITPFPPHKRPRRWDSEDPPVVIMSFQRRAR